MGWVTVPPRLKLARVWVLARLSSLHSGGTPSSRVAFRGKDMLHPRRRSQTICCNRQGRDMMDEATEISVPRGRACRGGLEL